jgi:signal peptidase
MVSTGVRKSEIKGYLAVIAIFIVIFAGYTAISRELSGTNIPLAVVESGSMEPNLPIGTLLFIQKVAPQDIVVGPPPTGDVVLYKLPNTQVTDYLVYANYNPPLISHRAIAEVVKNGTYYFEVKGDANPSSDYTYPGGLVPQDAIVGRVVYDVPYVGYIFLWAKNPYVLVTVLILLLIIIFIPWGSIKRRHLGQDGTNTSPPSPSPPAANLSQSSMVRLTWQAMRQ